MPMLYRMRAYWNGTKVLDAEVTATMASDVAAEFLRGNFAGAYAKQAIDRQLGNLLDRVLDGQTIDLAFEDITGKAFVTIWRHYETAQQVQPEQTLRVPS